MITKRKAGKDGPRFGKVKGFVCPSGSWSGIGVSGMSARVIDNFSDQSLLKIRRIVGKLTVQ
jgi:hypothetical protein